MITRQSLWLGGACGLFLAGIGAAAVVCADSLTAAGEAAAVPALIRFAWLAGGLALGLVGALGKIIDLILLRPQARLAVELRAIAHGDRQDGIDPARFASLPVLAAAAGELTQKLGGLRRQRSETVAAAAATASAETEKLAAILNDLHEGVVVCNMRHQVVLYNQVTLRLLQVTGEMGLGRSLFGLVAKEPILHMLDVLLHRAPTDPGNAPFITGTTDGRSLLQGRMSLVRGAAGGGAAGITGYVISFNDVTDQVAALARRDALLREIIDGLRDPVARLGDPAADPARAAADIATALERVTRGYRRLLAGWWPMSDIHSADLFAFVIRRLEHSELKATLTGLPLWLHGDSHSLALALEALLRAIAGSSGARAFDLSAAAEDGHGWIQLSWFGERVDDDSLIAWQRLPVSGALGGMTILDVMKHHAREDLIEEAVDGRVTLRIALSLGREGQDRGAETDRLPPRPEFFDFNLLAQGQTGDRGAVRLRDLTYVVFDTETTGLRPTQGDRVVSLAAVRIVNGRILTGESFNRVVNPGRPIPAESVKFHGITDEMVVGKPSLAVVLPQFHAYVTDAVLVAHNAAFDLKFIRMREEECGLSFDNPVLDTMLLSSYVDGTPENQSLDAIAERYGVRVTDRHTALGDSLVTAAVLLRLIEALETKGINTLDEAMTTLNMTMELHNRAQAFG